MSTAMGTAGSVRRIAAAAVAAVGISVVALAQPASAAPGDLALASTTADDVKGNNDSFVTSLSADGTTVAFTSEATNLDPADTDIISDVYVKDLASGELTLVSTSDSGVKGNGSSFAPSLSADGATVAFVSVATNLQPPDTNSRLDVYVKDLASGELTLASTSSTGVKGNGDSSLPSLSADGSTVAFHSEATNLDPADTDDISDVYVKDLTTGEVTLVSISDAGVKGNGSSFRSSLSADGATVAFESRATNLDPADTDGISDIFVKDLDSGELTLASTSSVGVKGNADSGAASLSADGATVAFESRATNLDPDATVDLTNHIFVKDLDSGELTLASTSSTGVVSNSDSFAPSLSADGSTVAFDSGATNLDPADTDPEGDIYVKDLTSGDITLASTSGDGAKSNGSSFRPSLSADGSTVAFESSATNLDPADTDDFSDVYVKELAPPNDPPPTIAVAAGGSCDPNGSTATIAITVTDPDGDPGALMLTATSSNQALLPDTAVTFGGAGRDRTVTTATDPGQSGRATVTITVTDGQDTASTTVTVIAGSNRSDRLTGTSGADIMLGKGGNDFLNAGAGNDLICGGSGNDPLRGDGGDDTLDGQSGNDIVNSGTGDDILRGGPSNDLLIGGPGADFYSGGTGLDVFVGFNPEQGDTSDGT
ncbi:MAG: PD40 domain-containing protein [Geodermatophilaceae bacterium]|nr:PD40 domain-containing protein [Geodermatophilaceae bacterium]